MFRKVAASSVLAAFISFSASCTTWGTKEVKTLAQRLPENSAVLSVVKNSGEVISFSKSNPGRVRGYAVVGTPAEKRVEIMGPVRSTKARADGSIYEIVDAKGQVYTVLRVLNRNDDRMTFLAADWVQVSIPLSEAREIEIKRGNPFLTTLAVIGGAAGGLFIVLALTLGFD